MHAWLHTAIAKTRNHKFKICHIANVSTKPNLMSCWFAECPFTEYEIAECQIADCQIVYSCHFAECHITESSVVMCLLDLRRWGALWCSG